MSINFTVPVVHTLEHFLITQKGDRRGGEEYNKIKV
jgi:hypothetical protein